jgi:hypothetical protein
VVESVALRPWSPRQPLHIAKGVSA